MSENAWSKAWSSTENPGKQRKYRYQAPYHHRGQFVSSRLADKLRDRVGTKTLPVRAGDEVKVVRGDFDGKRGEVQRVDREEYKIYIEGVKRETVSGSEVRLAIDPSNVIITQLNLDDDERVAKYDMTEAEKEEIRAEASPDESEDEAADEETEDAVEDTEETTEPADVDSNVDYEELAKENIADIKEAVDEQDLDLEALLAAEQDNKDRKTLVEWLESRIEGDGA